jgi:hypothetical protein
MFYSFIGWVGVLLFVVVYLLLSLEYFNAKKPLYYLLNFIAAACLVINGIKMLDYPCNI